MVHNLGNQPSDINTAVLPPSSRRLSSIPPPPLLHHITRIQITRGGTLGSGPSRAQSPPPGQHAYNVLSYSSNTHYVYRASRCKCEIVKCFLCDTLVTRHLFTGHQLDLNQLILISSDKGQDCFLITDRFQLCLGFPCLFAPPFIHAFNTFPCVILL